MNWTVSLSHKAEKQVARLLKDHPKVFKLAAALIKEIEVSGPYHANWKNYSALSRKDDTYHCHIKDGKPTYVVCWRVENKAVRIVEVYYVGSHEGAPY